MTDVPANITVTVTALLSLGSAIVGALATIVGVVISNKLTATRSYEEKIWDLRRMAYSVILSEFAAIERVYAAADEFQEQSDFLDYFNRGLLQQDEREINKHLRVIYQRMAEDYLILSDGFISLYNKYAEEARGDPYNDGVEKEYEASSNAVRKYRPLLVSRAREEIATYKK